MKHATRPQIHAYGLAALLLLVVALVIALAMLGHSTMAGGPQWSAGALAGGLVVLAIASLIAIVIGIEAVEDLAARRRAKYAAQAIRLAGHRTIPGSVETGAKARSLADDLLGRQNDDPEATAYWARDEAHTAVYGPDDAAVDLLVRQRSHHRAARRSLTHRH